MTLRVPAEIGKIADFVGLLYVITLILSLIYGPQPLFAAISADFSVSGASISLLVSVAMLPLGIAPLLYGALLNKVPARRLLQITMLLLALAGIPGYFTHSFAVLLAFRLLQGLLIPAVLTSLMTHVSSQYQGTELQRAMSAYVGVTLLGGLLGRIISASLAELFGWRAAMLLISLGIGLGIFLVSRYPGEARSRFSKIRLNDFARMLRDSVLLRLLLFETGGFFVFSAVGNSLPFYLNSLSSEISELRVAFMYSGYALGALIAFSSRRVMGFLGGEERAMLKAWGLYILAMPFLQSTNIGVVFGAMTALCLAQFTQHSVCPGLINRVSAEERGMVNGLCLSFYYTGGALGAYLSVLLYTHVSWLACIVLFSAVSISMLCIAFSLRGRLPDC